MGLSVTVSDHLDAISPWIKCLDYRYTGKLADFRATRTSTMRLVICLVICLVIYGYQSMAINLWLSIYGYHRFKWLLSHGRL
jgi:hypothetical protein